MLSESSMDSRIATPLISAVSHLSIVAAHGLKVTRSLRGPTKVQDVFSSVIFYHKTNRSSKCES
jgi:hypothetical protein